MVHEQIKFQVEVTMLCMYIQFPLLRETIRETVTWK